MGHPMNKHQDNPYYYWCQGCQCYEYDCRDEEFCIRRHPDYKPPTQRAVARIMQQAAKAKADGIREIGFGDIDEMALDCCGEQKGMCRCND